MHYLVTGGCGFIGSHLVEKLLADGHRVTVLDDLSTGKRENTPQPEITIVEGDITTPGIFIPLLKDVDGCFHLAAIASVQQSKEEWLRTHQVNLSGTIALFDAISKSGRKIPVVFASSAAVYGACEKTPIAESEPCHPLSAYGADKLSCELGASIATSIHDIPTAGMRFFNVYGPRQDPHSPYSGVISIFTARMKKNEPITIFGDGKQSRDFIYVADVVRALHLAMQALQQGRYRHEILNVCTGKQTAITELANQLLRLTRSGSVIGYANARDGDIRVSLGNPAKSQRLLGFNPTVALSDGLQQTLDSL